MGAFDSHTTEEGSQPRAPAREPLRRPSAIPDWTGQVAASSTPALPVELRHFPPSRKTRRGPGSGPPPVV